MCSKLNMNDFCVEKCALDIILRVTCTTYVSDIDNGFTYEIFYVM